MRLRVVRGQFSSPAVKYETASSGIASWLDAYRDIIRGMKWLLSPALLITMAFAIGVLAAGPIYTDASRQASRRKTSSSPLSDASARPGRRAT